MRIIWFTSFRYLRQCRQLAIGIGVPRTRSSGWRGLCVVGRPQCLPTRTNTSSERSFAQARLPPPRRPAHEHDHGERNVPVVTRDEEAEMTIPTTEPNITEHEAAQVERANAS